MTVAGLRCGTCETALPENARFCHACGSPVARGLNAAEYKQVTVLFADVVGSMDIAAAVDTERLREIIGTLVNRSTAVVQRYGGTVDKFTGDGVMALFGAPIALEDHAFRACLAALDIQKETERLAGEVRRADGIELQLRVGLNSGQVIAGDVGSSAAGYTAIGQQVGMAQRMESVAPAGGVMLSESTARLVEHVVALGEPELVRIKGAGDPVPARRLLGPAAQPGPSGRGQARLVGRRWEMAAVEGILDRSIDGHGGVVGVVGPAGIGKSRVVRELAALAADRGVEVVSTFCESHASEVPFHVVARLLRAGSGVADLDGAAARAQVRAQIPDADPADLLLFDDLLGIADPEVALPTIDPDARRRRLTALINAASLARIEPAVYVIEDVHWIDGVSESLLADFLAVIPQTPSMVLITYRPEYRGALAAVAGAQTIALAPLSGSETSALIAELLGSDPSVAGLAALISERADGNPFFVEEIVRDLSERAVLQGGRGAYLLQGDAAEVKVPATLQATIAARIDRLGPGAKQTLNAAAVIGSRFSAELLPSMGIDAVVDELVTAELIDQVRFTTQPEYAFRHPLIRTVAYESQLRSGRAELHRRAAAAIEARDPVSVDENAALIADHLEAAGDLHQAYARHMRAGTWLAFRDFASAKTSWTRARLVADRLSDDDPDRMSMRIAPRTLLCANAFRMFDSGFDSDFEELRDLCTAADDQRSLAIGISGLVASRLMNAPRREASRLADELVRLIESIGDPMLTVGLSYTAVSAKHETGEMAEVLRLTQQVIDLAQGDPTIGNLSTGSPLAGMITMRGVARYCLGISGWQDDLDQGVAMARAFDPATLAGVMWYRISAIPHGVLLPDETALRDTAELFAMAKQSGDDLVLHLAGAARGITLAHLDIAERKDAFDVLTEVRDSARRKRYTNIEPVVDIHIAREKARSGDLDGAIELARSVVIDLSATGGVMWCVRATAVLVESLLRRGSDADLRAARSAIDRLAAVPTDPGFVLHEIWLLRLRALLARAHDDEVTYREFADRYRKMATELGFEGHIAMAEAMT